MSLLPIYVFTAGSGRDAPDGNPRRFNITLDGDRPLTQGWKKVMDFNALSTSEKDTFPVYVSARGGTGPTDPYHSLVSGSAPDEGSEWKDSYTFHAFYPDKQVHGTKEFYVMNTEGTSESGPLRSEVTTDPVTHPGWHLSLTFHAYPSDYKPPLETVYVSESSEERRPHRFRISKNADNPDGWISKFSFRVYSSPGPNTFPIYISKAGAGHGVSGIGPLRYFVGNDDDGTEKGWEFCFRLYPLVKKIPDSKAVPVYVMEAGGYGGPGDWLRFKLSLTDDATETGWTYRFLFYAYPRDY